MYIFDSELKLYSYGVSDLGTSFTKQPSGLHQFGRLTFNNFYAFCLLLFI